jgi:hypothetical protein
MIIRNIDHNVHGPATPFEKWLATLVGTQKPMINNNQTLVPPPFSRLGTGCEQNIQH